MGHEIDSDDRFQVNCPVAKNCFRRFQSSLIQIGNLHNHLQTNVRTQNFLLNLLKHPIEPLDEPIWKAH